MKVRELNTWLYIALVLLSILAWVTVVTFIQVIATNNMSAETNIKLVLDREEINYLCNVPRPHDERCLWFTWMAQTDPPRIGEKVYVQFSHDGKEWYNLWYATVDSNGTAYYRQPVDNSWAIVGENYLRAIIEDQTSNVVILRVNQNMGYWIVTYVGLVMGFLVLLWHMREKIRNLPPLKAIEKRFRACTSKRKVLLIFILASLIRILIAPWTEQRFDNYVNRLWCSLIYIYELYPFEPHMPPNYPLILRYAFPPVWLFVILSLFPVWLTISEYDFPQEPMYLWKRGLDVENLFESYRSFVPPTLPFLDFLFKLPNIIADIGIGYLLYRFAKSSKHERAVFFMWFFNPFTIHISAIWGLFDPLCTLLALLSVYLIWKRKIFSSAISLSIGVATKLYPMFFLAPILIYVYKEQGLRKSLKYLLVSLSAGMLIFGSFLFFPGGLEFVYRLFIFKASPDLYGKNFFSGLTWTYVFSLIRLERNLPIFPLIFIPTYFWLNYSFWKGKTDFDSLVTCFTNTLLATYLSYTVVNPQYVFWVLPFLLYLVVREKFPKRLYIIFSAIPLIFIYACYNPLQLVSPVIISEEWNYGLWSDLITQLWPVIFNGVTIVFLMGLFSALSLFSLLSMKKYSKGGLTG